MIIKKGKFMYLCNKNYTEKLDSSYFKGFLKGFNSLVSFYNTPKYKLITEEDVANMTRDNWKAVGDNLKKSIKDTKREF